MPDAAPAFPPIHTREPRHASWHARLALAFECAQGRTTLARREHQGPLVVQKPLHPEGPEVSQCIVVHPPGGIAGGDAIELDVTVGAGAHAQLTTPGATKWYRAAGRRASQSVTIRVADGAVLEWLPQGTIVFDGADAASTLRVELAPAATYVGWDVVCLGRTASAERFTHGQWRQRIEIVRGDALLWSERAVLRGGSPLLSSIAGLNDAPVFGTFAAMAPTFPEGLLTACRAPAPGEGEGAVTRLPHTLVARWRGHSMEAAHAYFAALWTAVRPALTGRVAVPPRIWAT